MNSGRVLVLDDNDAVRLSVAMYFGDLGFATHEAATLAAALRVLESESFDIAVVDYMLPDGTALDLLRRLKEAGSGLPVIVLTGHGSIELAVRAIQAGAEQFLTKPLELPALLEVVRRTIEGRRSQRREAAERSRSHRDALDPFCGASPQMRALAEDARRVAGADLPVLIQGETGSGKGVLAAWLHANGPRATEALVDINCAGLNAQLIESELFGHERGAFTSANAVKPGLLEIAHRGTLFLDEIGDLDLAVQPKLLKVLEDKRFRRLGGVRDKVVDVRLIAASHVDLQAAVNARRFRSDLLFRINALTLRVPPLRERPEDLPMLAARVLEHRGASAPTLAPDAVRALQAYPWPGNIRELRNVLERAALLGDRSLLTARDLRLIADEPARAPRGTPDPIDVDIVPLEENERRYLLRVLASKHGRVDEVARALEVPLSSLYQRLKRLGITLGRA